MHSSPVVIFLAGDVMTGRGIDQVLPHPGDPTLHESYMKSAMGYVELAEAASGPVERPVSFSYIWGDALAELERARPDLRVVNLETAVTKSGDYWPGKEVHYRMSPENMPCLKALGVDCCTLANNHVMDWGYRGLEETLDTLRRAGIRAAGAGRDIREAEAPAVFDLGGKGRVVIFSLGSPSSGVPREWAAAANRPGVDLLRDFSDDTVRRIKERVGAARKKGDIVAASIHWGGNWGFDISASERGFAHRLIDEAGVDLVHGHSSHHVRGIEVYKDRLVLYGCGDFIDDYEGIGGYEGSRGDLGLMYFASIEPGTGRLLALRMTPTVIKHMRVNRASGADALWLKDTLDREGKGLGTGVVQEEDGSLLLRWK